MCILVPKILDRWEKKRVLYTFMKIIFLVANGVYQTSRTWDFQKMIVG